MRLCIYCHPPLLPMFYSEQLNRKEKQQQFKASNLVNNLSGALKFKPKWLINLPQRQRISSLQTKSLLNSFIILGDADATSPVKSGDLSVILQTGGLLLFVYYISNFIVPELISKSYSSDETIEEQQRTDSFQNKDKETGTNITSQSESLNKKRGFNSSKR